MASYRGYINCQAEIKDSVLLLSAYRTKNVGHHTLALQTTYNRQQFERILSKVLIKVLSAIDKMVEHSILQECMHTCFW